MARRIHQRKQTIYQQTRAEQNHSGGATKLDKIHHFKLNELSARQNLSLVCVAYTNKIPTNHDFVNLKFVKTQQGSTENRYSVRIG